MADLQGVEQWGPDGSGMHWDDPGWVAALRQEIEAKVIAEDPAATPSSDEDWEGLLKIFGV